ncbi:MAG: ATP-binding cassette domain-containing protein, partial [Acidobacteria bacterium]|nr:ATP-binding cassette domain-containing protein [Acidobacteriota bacterium]
VGASEKVFEYLDTQDEVPEKPGAAELPPFRESIVFEKVNFNYGNGSELLRDIDLSITAGTVVAIVGASGAGKTSLVNLLPRFFDVTGGRLLIDGVDTRDVTLKSLRRQVSMVTQETILFHDTVLNNICYGRPPETLERAEEVARAALAHDFITRLPDGYRTVLGEHGQKLSGGQRQRIAIARALMKNAPILILDEATSELDSESERLVQQALSNLMAGRTVFVIAHRLSTVRQADRIIVLDNGAITEVGTHDDLLSRGGIYRKLHELQVVTSNM